ncbi:hypothetical protein M413DRAFT_22059 [Hebeloma cylindrosporum]|uniref:DUF6532 domain-containing protein n=1 Tax=Hebeloma cylindrosporum TaxID=76867 RepID=A0A0C2Z2B6_HEBCY|nr:hypothetical protein M413DRAFT_22059 [Hebeloma cylindrosporum h7]
MEDDHLIDGEQRRRKRNNTRLQREEEERRLIAEGEGPRRAKMKALSNASWLEAQGKKRPRSPSAEKTMKGGNPNPERAENTPRQKVQKRTASGREGSKDKKSQNSSKSTKSKPRSKAKVPAQLTRTIDPADEDSSSSPSDLSGSDDDQGKSSTNDSLNGEESDEDSDSNSDDEFSATRMTEREARQMFDDEMPRDAATLFDDDDDDVEMASIKSNASRSRNRSSSEASRPPTSESEGLFDVTDNDDDDELPANISASSRKSKQPKAAQRISKRDAALQSERPTTLRAAAPSTSNSSTKQSSNVKSVESDDNTAVSEDAWPKAMRLRPGGLTHQTDLIRAVCHDAIRIVEKTLVTQHAWPELHQGTTYKRQVLLDAIKSLRAKDTGEDQKEKEQYIGKWVVDRLSHHRGQMRSAASDHIAIFQLGIGDVCCQRVQALIENDVYVYPGQWATDKEGKPVWMAKNSVADVQIYLNPGLIALIKTAFFNGPTAFGYKFKKDYISTHPDHKEPELTIPLVALGATAFFAALYEWRDGKKARMSVDSFKAAKSEKFEGDNFKKVYDRHVETLSKLKKKVNTYHHVMSTLYSKAVDGEKAVDTGALVKGSALAVLDLDGLD